MRRAIKNFYKYYERIYRECKDDKDEEIKAHAIYVHTKPIEARKWAIIERESSIRWIDSHLSPDGKKKPSNISKEVFLRIKEIDSQEIDVLRKEIEELKLNEKK